MRLGNAIFQVDGSFYRGSSTAPYMSPWGHINVSYPFCLAVNEEIEGFLLLVCHIVMKAWRHFVTESVSSSTCAIRERKAVFGRVNAVPAFA